MRIWNWMLALLAVACMSVALPTLNAQDMGGEDKPAEEKKPDGDKKDDAEDKDDDSDDEDKEEDPVEELKSLFKDVDKVIDGVKLTEEDIKSYIAHTDSFDTAMEEDEKFEELKDKSIKEAYDYAVKSDKYTAWATKEGVDADWLKKAIRIMVLNFKTSMSGDLDEQVKALEEQKKMIEGMKGDLGEEEYKEAVEGLDEALKMMKGMGEVAKGLPAPTEEEAKLLEKFADELNG